MTIPAPSFIECAGTQMEARFQDGISLYLSRGEKSGRIYSHRPFRKYLSWEPSGLTEEQDRAYQAAALTAFTSGAGRLEIDSDGDVYAVVS